MTEWFEQWFGETYLELYPHRDDEDAAQAVRLIAANVPLEGCRVLDLACGPGRHSERLREIGAGVVGFDLSMPLLSQAWHRAHPPLPVVRGDMRCLPFRSGSFDVVVNLFTSFGYFSSDDQHQAVLRQAAAVLRTGGVFVIDYFNTTQLLANLVEYEEQKVGIQRVVISRRVSDDGRFVLKEMKLIDDGHSFTERVRLFSPADLERLVEDADLSVRNRFGNYTGDPLTQDSPRVVILAERS